MLPARRIHPTERDAVLDTLVEAFRSDPQLRWYFPDDSAYATCAPRFFGVLLDTRMEGGEVWVTDDLGAVSLWIPPGGNLAGPERAAARYADVVAALPGPAPGRITLTDDVVGPLLPTEPHWYLGVLGCRPECRRSGLGSVVMRPVLAAADRAGLPVALETSTARNVDYYIRRGFAVAACRPLGDGAPTVRVMRREPSLLADPLGDQGLRARRTSSTT